MKSNFVGRWFTLSALMALGCGDSTSLDASKAVTHPADEPTLTPEVVNAGTPQNDPGHPLAARFWIEADPKTSELTQYEIHPGNVIYREHGISMTQSALAYDYTGGGVGTRGTCSGATCVPGANSIRLSTPASSVTFMDNMANCTSNNVPGCTPSTATCQQPNTFCFFAQAVSKYADALPNLILTFQNAGGCGSQTPITGCQPNDTDTSQGLCHTTDPARVDSASSTLTSCITGDNATTFGCSYCLGNADGAAGAGLPGLSHAVMPNIAGTADGVMKGVNTANVAFQLANSMHFTFVAELRYALPSLVPMGTPQITLLDSGIGVGCATPGMTEIRIDGGSFGPPAACYGSQPLAGCPATDLATANAPAAGFSIHVNNVPIPPGSYTKWSDTEVGGIIPVDMVNLTPSLAGVTATVIGPLGDTGASTDTFSICP